VTETGWDSKGCVCVVEEGKGRIAKGRNGGLFCCLLDGVLCTQEYSAKEGGVSLASFWEGRGEVFKA
jgi:hypothetical protein